MGSSITFRLPQKICQSCRRKHNTALRRNKLDQSHPPPGERKREKRKNAGFLMTRCSIDSSLLSLSMRGGSSACCPGVGILQTFAISTGRQATVNNSCQGDVRNVPSIPMAKPMSATTPLSLLCLETWRHPIRHWRIRSRQQAGLCVASPCHALSADTLDILCHFCKLHYSICLHTSLTLQH